MPRPPGSRRRALQRESGVRSGGLTIGWRRGFRRRASRRSNKRMQQTKGGLEARRRVIIGLLRGQAAIEHRSRGARPSQLIRGVGQTTEGSRPGPGCRTKSNEIADLNRRLTGLLTAEAQDRRQIGRAAVATERGAAYGCGGGRRGVGRSERVSQRLPTKRVASERSAATPRRPQRQQYRATGDRIQQRLTLREAKGCPLVDPHADAVRQQGLSLRRVTTEAARSDELPNKEMKLTSPEPIEGSQLISGVRRTMARSTGGCGCDQ
jgi:hypothetical protein